MTPEEKALLDLAIRNMNQLLIFTEQTLGITAPEGSYQNNVKETDSELAAGLKIINAKQTELMRTYEQYYAKQKQDALAQTQENNNSQSLGPIL